MKDLEIRQKDLTCLEEYDFDDEINYQKGSQLYVRLTRRAWKGWCKRVINLKKIRAKEIEVKDNQNNKMMRKVFTVAATLWIRACRKRVREMRTLHRTGDDVASASDLKGPGTSKGREHYKSLYVHFILYFINYYKFKFVMTLSIFF